MGLQRRHHPVKRLGFDNYGPPPADRLTCVLVHLQFSNTTTHIAFTTSCGCGDVTNIFSNMHTGIHTQTICKHNYMI